MNIWAFLKFVNWPWKITNASLSKNTKPEYEMPESLVIKIIDERDPVSNKSSHRIVVESYLNNVNFIL